MDNIKDDAEAIADDVRKITEALKFAAKHILSDGKLEAAIKLAKSLPGKIEALERERDNAIKSKEMTEKFLGGSLYSARMALQRRAEAAEAQLAECTLERDTVTLSLAARDAEIGRLRQVLSEFRQRAVREREKAGMQWGWYCMGVLYADNDIERIDAALTASVAEKEEE